MISGRLPSGKEMNETGRNGNVMLNTTSNNAILWLSDDDDDGNHSFDLVELNH